MLSRDVVSVASTLVASAAVNDNIPPALVDNLSPQAAIRSPSLVMASRCAKERYTQRHPIYYYRIPAILIMLSFIMSLSMLFYISNMLGLHI